MFGLKNVGEGSDCDARLRQVPRAGLGVKAQSLDDSIERSGLPAVGILKANIEAPEHGAILALDQQARRLRNLADSCYEFVSDSGGEAEFRAELKGRLIKVPYVVTERSEAKMAWKPDGPIAKRAAGDAPAGKGGSA